MQTSPIETAWMKCKVLKGMFSNEYLVVVNDRNDNEYGEMFVDKFLVKLDQEKDLGMDDSVPGRVRVRTTWQKNESSDLISVMLPASTIQNGRYLEVPENWLTES